ncbi:MAG: AraC family transcriptional regulator [Akkermansiaceae bacterium]|jgi:AraC family transcriptional regulator of adaptative response/methylated-DNA-[protein]-cysteine methyltransferase
MNDYERMARVIRHLDESFHQQPSLEDFAATAGLSPSHFHRLFSKLTGVTPKDFVQCLTAQHAKQMLREGASVLNSALDAGLSGPTRPRTRSFRRFSLPSPPLSIR